MTDNSQRPDYNFSLQPEILRLNQQDDYYLNYLKSKIIDAIELFTPWLINYRLISKNEDLIKMAAGIIYYSLTTLRSSQTLGEEYTSLAQYNSNYKGFTWQNYPNIGRARKVMYVLLSAVFPVVSTRILKKLYNHLKQKLYIDLHKNSFRKSLIKHLPDYESFVQALFKLHLAVFFVEGVYLQVARRFTATKYIYTKKPQDHGLGYYNVGRLMLIQIGIEIIKFFYKSYRSYQFSKRKRVPSVHSLSDFGGDNQTDPSNAGDESKICPLCYQTRKNTACTPCGHLFCWECVVKNCLIKEECPQCRKICKPNKIIQLRNFT